MMDEDPGPLLASRAPLMGDSGHTRVRREAGASAWQGGCPCSGHSGLAQACMRHSLASCIRTRGQAAPGAQSRSGQVWPESPCRPGARSCPLDLRRTRGCKAHPAWETLRPALLGFTSRRAAAPARGGIRHGVGVPSAGRWPARGRQPRVPPPRPDIPRPPPGSPPSPPPPSSARPVAFVCAARRPAHPGPCARRRRGNNAAQCLGAGGPAMQMPNGL